MGMFIATAASLIAVYGGAAGTELLLSRLATPEARLAGSGPAAGQAEASRPVHGTDEQEGELV